MEARPILESISPIFCQMCSKLISLIIVMACLASCTNSVDPHTMSGTDFIFRRKELRQYLDERWEVLASLRGEVRRLDGKIRVQLNRLHAAQRDLASAARAEAGAAGDRRQAEEALSRKQQEGEDLQNRVQRAQGEITRLDGQVKESNISSQAAEARAAEIERGNAKISREIDLYQKSNDQTIQLGQQALRRRQP